MYYNVNDWLFKSFEWHCMTTYMYFSMCNMSWTDHDQQGFNTSNLSFYCATQKSTQLNYWLKAWLFPLSDLRPDCSLCKIILLFLHSVLYILRSAWSAAREEIRVVCPNSGCTGGTGVLCGGVHRQCQRQEYIETGMICGPYVLQNYIVHHASRPWYITMQACETIQYLIFSICSYFIL